MTNHPLNIRKIMENHENTDIEFKQAFRWNYYKRNIDKNMPKTITKTISAFLNGDGGILIIGLTDNGTIMGVEKDIRSYNKNNYQKGKDLLLTDIGEVIRRHIGIEVSSKYNVQFKPINNKEIIVIEILPYRNPVLHLKKDFYVRSTNTTVKLTRHETFSYIKDKFNIKLKSSKLEYLFFALMGYIRLFKIVIKKKKEVFYPLFTLGIIYYIIWYIYLFIDYNKSIIFFPFPFLMFSLSFIVLFLFINRDYKKIKRNYKIRKKSSDYIPEIDKSLILVIGFIILLNLLLLTLATIKYIQFFKDNYVALIIITLAMIGLLLILFTSLYRHFKNLPTLEEIYELLDRNRLEEVVKNQEN